MFYKLLFISLLSLLSHQLNEHCIEYIRRDYHALNSEKKVRDFINRYHNTSCEKAIPYLASAMMQQAQYTIFPHKKFNYFVVGKAQLEQFIARYPNDIEGRYVRLLVQSNSPALLGYKANMKEDKTYIENYLPESDLPISYQETIKKAIAYLNN